MRNLLKKTASMLLCLSLAMSLAACGGNGGGSGTVNPEAPSSDVSNEEKKVEAPVKGFLDDFCNLEFSNLNDYLLEEEEELASFDFDALLEEEITGAITGSGMEEYADLFRPLIDKYLDVITSNMNYEIVETVKDGENYKVNVEFSSIPLADIINAMNSIDDAAGEDLGTKLVEEGKLTEGMSEEEMMKVVLEATVEYMSGVLDETAKNAKPVIAELDFVVSEKDGEWLIDNNASDIEEIESIFTI